MISSIDHQSMNQNDVPDSINFQPSEGFGKLLNSNDNDAIFYNHYPSSNIGPNIEISDYKADVTKSTDVIPELKNHELSLTKESKNCYKKSTLNSNSYSEQYESSICSFFQKATEIIAEYSIIGALSVVFKENKTPKQRKKPKVFDQSDAQYYELYMIDGMTELPVRKKSLDEVNNDPIDLNYESWVSAGISYRVQPSPCKLQKRPTLIDFITQSHLKSVLVGSENGDPQPPENIFSEAQLKLSAKIDFNSWKLQKYLASEERLLEKRMSGQTVKIDGIVRKRIQLNRELYEYTDTHCYNYNPYHHLNSSNIKTIKFPVFRWSKLSFYCFVVALLEHQVFGKRKCVLGRVVKKVLPLLRSARKRPGMEYHIIASLPVASFLFALFQIFERLESVVENSELVVWASEYDVLGFEFQVPMIKQYMKRLSEGVDEGSVISQPFYDARNAALNIFASGKHSEFKRGLQFVKEGRNERDYVRAMQLEYPGQRLYGISFREGEGEAVEVAVVNPELETKQRFLQPKVSDLPMGQLLRSCAMTNKLCDEPDYVPARYEWFGLRFKMNHASNNDCPIEFIPGTYDFFFSLT